MPDAARTRSDSLEEPGSQQDRKRPRLESGNNDQLSCEEALTDSGYPEPKITSASLAPQPASDRHLVVSSTTDPPKMATSPSGLSSRVTINTRSTQNQPLSPMPPNSSQLSDTTVEDDRDTLAMNLSAESEASSAIATVLPEVISVSSSPSRSPEIQVAELEDIDGDSVNTKWTPVTRLTGNSARQQPIAPQYVYRTFPYARAKCTSGAVNELIPQLAKYFQGGSASDGKLFLEVKCWLLKFLQDHRQLTLDLILEERDFWWDFPDIVAGLLRRHVDAPQQARPEDLRDFFVAYGELTLLFIRFDLQFISQYTNATDPASIFETFSKPYLPTLTWMIQYRDIPFYDVLRLSRGYDVADLVSAVVDRLASSEINLMHYLSVLAEQIVALLPKKPAFTATFNQIVAAMYQFVKSCSDRVLCNASEKYNKSPTVAEINAHGFDFFLKADQILQTAIVKQLPWLTIENSPELLRTISRAFACIAEQDPALGAQVLQKTATDMPEIIADELFDVIALGWKFKTLRKYITAGRMELRVYGMDAMSNDLVHVWKCHIQYNADSLSVPLVRFLVEFLQISKMVEYIVGIDSHPQLISRSSNVVGFLCVTSTYTEKDSDMIWKTVTGSQDPRTVAEVLNVLKAILGMSHLSTMLYLCAKLMDLPIERFDLRMLDFTGDLLHFTRDKLQRTPRTSQHEDTLPYRLCIRLFRDSSAAQLCSPEQKLNLQHFAADQLTWLLRLVSVDSEDKSKLWELCIRDVAEKNNFATGSLFALNTWIMPQAAANTVQLATHFNFTRLLVDNLAHLVNPGSPTIADVTFLDNMLPARLLLLMHLITFVPETFTEDLSESLWESVFASHTLGQPARDFAWGYLSDRIALIKQTPNAFFDMFVTKFLPRLVPHDFSEKILDFVQQSVIYETRWQITPPQQQDGVVLIPGIDRVWRFILEAPPNTVETDATNWVIKQYLDHEIVIGRSRATIEATHLSLVERCVREVISAAARLKSFVDGTMSGEDEPMVIIASEEEIRRDEMRFDRSLLFLRQFLQGMKSRPRYSPPPTNEPDVSSKPFEDRGEPIHISYQRFPSSGSLGNFPIMRISAGDLNTGDELAQYLVDLTGFTQFTCISGGQKVDLFRNAASLRDLRIGSGLLLVRKIPDSPEKLPSEPRRPTSPIDCKIMDHFDELYDLLDLEERLAKEVFGFLHLFAPQPRVHELVRSMNASVDELLPVSKPYKLLYCANALRSSVEDEALSSKPDAEFLKYSVRTIIATFDRPIITEGDKALHVLINHGLMECLLLALRAQVSPEVSSSYISDPEGYAQYLLTMTARTQHCQELEPEKLPPRLLIREPFAALIEGALHDERLWQAVQSNPNFSTLVKHILLDDGRLDVRKAVASVILALSGPPTTKLMFKPQDPRSARSRFPIVKIEASLAQLWKSLLDIIPEAVAQPSQCQQLFEVCLAVLRCIGKSVPSSDLISYFQQWANLLTSYHHKEIIGRSSEDYVVWGFTKLLADCHQLLQAGDSIISTSDLAKALLSKFLFPELSDAKSPEIQPRIPVLKDSVREDLYGLVLALSKGQKDIDMIVESLEDLVPKDEYFEPNAQCDRQSLRSEVGYAGLRNLSNTCYLNSLFSQLFMNLGFRNFLLQVNVADETSQRLVVELSKVFSHMQNAWGKAVDPSSAVESIPTYENEQIDVSIQMDVDEFFNLLFDRLEAQMVVPEAKSAFRSLYGGQLVQQIKSRECEHISERLEPFSSIQCEIKGRVGLEDSLRAYVEGEVMQGDNKYSCTSCNRHVDAVKRACLKDVPDHLIFNLKRFDFDIASMTRCKVNDEFRFPEKIDMAPYTVEYLSGPEGSVPPDIFELVGVLVHSGTAESGHYYSYVRERPSSKSMQDSWLQFNDSDVNVFDPAQIAGCCYGGTDMSSALQLSKGYSAYMLFYQRVASILQFEKTFTQHDMANPVRLRLAPEMETYIAQNNELFIRSYCAQDPHHARFVRQVLERMQWGKNHQCSDQHGTESRTLEVALDYVQQISCRFKEMPEVEATMKILRGYASQCNSCASTIVKWLLSASNIRDTVLKNPQALVRRSFSHLLFEALRTLKNGRRVQGFVPAEISTRSDNYPVECEECVELLGEQWEDLPRYSRAWNEYFELLAQIANLGHWEASRLLDHGFLERVMEIIWVDARTDTKKLKKKYAAFVHMREKGRVFSHNGLLSFLAAILEHLDISLPPHSDGDRDEVRDLYGLTQAEQRLFAPMQASPRTFQKFEWLRRIIGNRHNPTAAAQIVASLILEPTVSQFVLNTLIDGLASDTLSDAVAFLEPTLVFCSRCTSATLVLRAVKEALEGIDSINSHYGKDHLDFVVALTKVENQPLHWDQDHFTKLVLRHIKWWAPVLLIYPDNDLHHDVKAEAVGLLNHCLLGPLSKPDHDLEIYEFLRKRARELAVACTKYVQEHYVSGRPDSLYPLEPGQAGQIDRVVMHIIALYFDSNDDHDVQQVEEIKEVFDHLRLRAAQAAVDEQLSESWQDNDSLAVSDSDNADVGEFDVTP